MSQNPAEKSVVTGVVRTAAVDKVDLLFAIDNSGSMGDKQALLREAIPDLIDRLVRPQCITADGQPTGTFDPKTGCAPGSEPEFAPIRDLHVGIVSSSLGDFGSNTCKTGHVDDHGHLVARTGAGVDARATAPAQPMGFLAYLPPVPENTGRPTDPNVVGAVPFEDPKAFVEAFQQLVVGVGEDGCGYEAQLESAYRFLAQPDPYASVSIDGSALRLEGIDTELLAQRARFMRPDSLLAVIVVTDENESTIDPNALGGQSWRFLRPDPLAPGTSICSTKPDDPQCASCATTAGRTLDPQYCASVTKQPDDNYNVRFFDPKRRFGMDPRYGIDRYVHAFSEPTVPDQKNDATRVCTNPIFAGRLPTGGSGEDLCKLPRGPRTKKEVVFAAITGVPWQLLTTQPADLSAHNPAPFKDRLDAADWHALLGPKTTTRRYDEAHPLLRESILPRKTAAGQPVAPDGAHDREWNTAGADLQYACTFELPTPKDCSNPRDSGCDCAVDTDSPLCNPQNPRQQLRGKGYPGLTTLAVARELEERAVVASVCPREVHDKTSPVYGYRPAMGAVLERIGDAISACVPTLHADADAQVPCLVLEAQPPGVNACDAARGRRPADGATVARLRARDESGGVFEGRTVCAVDQLGASARGGQPCADAGAAGFCYVTGKEAGKHCGQALRFSKSGAQLPGATVYLQCIDETKAEVR